MAALVKTLSAMISAGYVVDDDDDNVYNNQSPRRVVTPYHLKHS